MGMTNLQHPQFDALAAAQFKEDPAVKTTADLPAAHEILSVAAGKARQEFEATTKLAQQLEAQATAARAEAKQLETYAIDLDGAAQLLKDSVYGPA